MLCVRSNSTIRLAPVKPPLTDIIHFHVAVLHVIAWTTRTLLLSSSHTWWHEGSTLCTCGLLTSPFSVLTSPRCYLQLPAGTVTLPSFKEHGASVSTRGDQHLLCCLLVWQSFSKNSEPIFHSSCLHPNLCSLPRLALTPNVSGLHDAGLLS